MNQRNDELMHYGVLGMKWGVRRARRASNSGNTEKANRIYSKTFAKSSKTVDKEHKKQLIKILNQQNFRRKRLRKRLKLLAKPSIIRPERNSSRQINFS